MSNILVLNSSLSGDASVSNILVADAVAALQAAHPGASVTTRDLANDPLPHLTPATVAGVRSVASTPAEIQARTLSETLLAELNAADAVVIGAPMYNFSIPSTLRAWFDHVVRPGVTFAYVDGAPRGLVANKPVIVVEARGGLYSEGPAQAVDFQEGYLRHLLGFIGLTDVTFIRAEKIGYGPEARDAAIAGARAEIARVVGGAVPLAA
ncbi:MAG: NAD(P)H-dependent oxidoreductase [Alphaproteobacteria bacterium]